MPELKEMTQQMMFLMDFTDKIILLILQDLTLLEALPLLQCNWRLCLVVSQFYLKHHGFVVWDDDVDDITLQGDVPTAALLMLSAYPFINQITLCCDLYYLVKYKVVFPYLLCWLQALIFFNIYFNPLDLALLHDPHTPTAILSTITVLPSGIFSFKIEKDLDPLPAKALSQPPHPQHLIHNCRLSYSICQICDLSLSMEFLVTNSLSKLYKRLLQGEAITSLILLDQLTCSTFNKFIKSLNLPVLTHLNLLITSQCGIHLPLQFFAQHPLLQSASLCTYGLMSQMPDPPLKTLFLPHLAQISLTSNHHLWVHSNPPALKHLHIRLPLSLYNPCGCTFCSMMRTLANPLKSVSAQPFVGLSIELSFPYSLREHILLCCETVNVCECAPSPQLIVPQVKSLTIGLCSFHPLMLVSDIYIDFI